MANVELGDTPFYFLLSTFFVTIYLSTIATTILEKGQMSFMAGRISFLFSFLCLRERPIIWFVAWDGRWYD